MGHELRRHAHYNFKPTMATVHAAMPGSFSFDATLPPKLDVCAKSLFFQPPKTPSGSTLLRKSTPSLSTLDVSNSTGRKRSRLHSYDDTTSSSSQSHAWSNMSANIQLDTPGAMSPVPFVNSRYELAGGLDTPTASRSSAMDNGEDDHRASPDLHLRVGRGIRGFDPGAGSYFPHSSSALAREGNGRPRIQTQPGIRDGLGRVVYTFVGAAGKVLQFCKTAAFNGFYAGGGQGYDMKPPLRSIDGGQSIWQDVETDDASQTWELEKSMIPGRFPDEDFYPNYMSQDHTTPPRASKKIQREKGSGEISASWVVVGSNPASRETSPSRLSHRKTPSTGASARRPAPKLGRRPILPASRPSLTSYAGSPGLRSDRAASFASPRSPTTSPKHESPVSVEVQRHAARMRKRELEEDANLKRFNNQLQAMIKEGKQALGTKFEVEEDYDEPVDQGYAEGGYFADRWKG